MCPFFICVWYIDHSMYTRNLNPPLSILNIPESINKRLSEISSDKECFDNAIGIYQEALNKSGYKYDLKYRESDQDTPSTHKNWPRNIIWYNPPYSKNVETNIWKRFLSLIDQIRSDPLHKIFNQNPSKLSYSCMPNIKTIISNHNKAKLSKSEQSEEKTVTAVIQTPAPWTEIAMLWTLFIKPKFPHWPTRRHTSDFVTQL